MKNKLIIIGAIVIAVIGSIVFWKYELKNRVAFISNLTNSQSEAQQFPAINGLPVEKSKASLRPIAVVVENHFDARPQSGLTDADIVYETLAEGGITRFLALFQTRTPKEIGPVRSARPYFNFIADEWSAGYAHVGGSASALSELDSNVYENLYDMNQFFNGDYFYRSQNRTAPHNAYTTVDLLRGLLSKKNKQDWTPKQLGSFGVVPTDQLHPTTTQISIKFFNPTYGVEFDYDPTTDSYKRTNGDQPSIDKNNNLQISPMNVLIQFVDDFSVPLETTTGLGLKLEKSGSVVLFSNGTATTGNWQFTNGFTSYTTPDNKPLTFVPGQTWIVLMPKSLTNNVTWK